MAVGSLLQAVAESCLHYSINLTSAKELQVTLPVRYRVVAWLISMPIVREAIVGR